MPQLPVANPLLGPTISGTTITVDTLTRPVTRIPAQIINLVAANQGYFADRLFKGGPKVIGGAVVYSETLPTDLFLDPTQSIAPRAPGSEAPYVGALRPVDKIARPESLAGMFEVHDEQRLRNDTSTISTLITRIANTFADRMQTRALTVANAAITAWGRSVASVGWAAAASAAGGTTNVARTTQPEAAFALMLKTFENDRVGQRPNIVILNPTDALNLRLIVGVSNVQGFLGSFGIDELLVSAAQTAGTALFVVRGGLGYILFEKPLDTEYQRVAQRKTDLYVTEATPVFVASDASAVLAVTGIGA